MESCIQVIYEKIEENWLKMEPCRTPLDLFDLFNFSRRVVSLNVRDIVFYKNHIPEFSKP